MPGSTLAFSKKYPSLCQAAFARAKEPRIGKSCCMEVASSSLGDSGIPFGHGKLGREVMVELYSELLRK